MRLEKRSTLVFPILLHTIETWDKLQPCEPRLACSEPFFLPFLLKKKRATAIPGKLKLIAFRASSFAHPSLLPLGLERLKNGQRLKRRVHEREEGVAHLYHVLFLYGTFWNRREYTFTGETHRNSFWAPRTFGSRFSSLASLTSSSTTFTRALTEKINN